MIRRFLSKLLFPKSMAVPGMGGMSTRLDLLGEAAPVHAAGRTISLTPETRHVNVEGGETVNFVVGSQNFAWNFFVGSSVTSFDLRLVAPPGMLSHSVVAYIAPDPRYTG